MRASFPPSIASNSRIYQFLLVSSSFESLSSPSSSSLYLISKIQTLTLVMKYTPNFSLQPLTFPSSPPHPSRYSHRMTRILRGSKYTSSQQSPVKRATVSKRASYPSFLLSHFTSPTNAINLGTTRLVRMTQVEPGGDDIFVDFLAEDLAVEGSQWKVDKRAALR